MPSSATSPALAAGSKFTCHMPAFETTDQGTREAFRAGNKEAYANIFREFYPALVNYGRKFCDAQEVVEDCAQEVLLPCGTMRNRLAAVQQVPAYLFVSFRNRLIKGACLPRIGCKQSSCRCKRIYHCSVGQKLYRTQEQSLAHSVHPIPAQSQPGAKPGVAIKKLIHENFEFDIDRMPCNCRHRVCKKNGTGYIGTAEWQRGVRHPRAVL